MFTSRNAVKLTAFDDDDYNLKRNIFIRKILNINDEIVDAVHVVSQICSVVVAVGAKAAFESLLLLTFDAHVSFQVLD